jgi:putative FmdB family regulatory protein
MPTYVYRCNKGHTFELFHSITDDTPKRCPRCRSAARRVPAGGAGFLFKGSGFYATDYRSSGYREAAKREREAGGGGKPAEAGANPPGEAAPSPAPAEPTKPAPARRGSRPAGPARPPRTGHGKRAPRARRGNRRGS